MRPFRWADRHGVVHELTDGDAIEREHRAVKAELLALRERLSSADDAVVTAVLGEAAPLRARLVALAADLRRYLRHAAEAASNVVGEIVAEAAHLARLHRCYQQQIEHTTDAPWLAGPPSAEQVAVLAWQAGRQQMEEPRPASFGAAHALLLADPETCRTPLPASFAAVEWTDRNVKYHQVRDLRQIEREYVAVAAELDLLAPRLGANVPIRDTIEALERAQPLVRRIAVLERTMNYWTAQVIAAARDDYRMFLDELEK